MSAAVVEGGMALGVGSRGGRGGTLVVCRTQSQRPWYFHEHAFTSENVILMENIHGRRGCNCVVRRRSRTPRTRSISCRLRIGCGLWTTRRRFAADTTPTSRARGVHAHGRAPLLPHPAPPPPPLLRRPFPPRDSIIIFSDTSRPSQMAAAAKGRRRHGHGCGGWRWRWRPRGAAAVRVPLAAAPPPPPLGIIPPARTRGRMGAVKDGFCPGGGKVEGRGVGGLGGRGGRHGGGGHA